MLVGLADFGTKFNMRYLALLTLCWLFAIQAHAQYSSPSVKLTDDLQTLDWSRYGQLGKKAPSAPKACGGDTLDYARYKASALVAINVSSGFLLGQYYDAPGEVTVKGFDFYAWQTMGTSDTITLYCHIHKAGIDSLPSGPPVRTDTIYVDSTFGSGQLTTLLKRVVFDSAYVTKDPYVLVVENRDSIRVGIVANSYQNRDGEGDYLGCGTVGLRWFNFRYLNIGGTPLDCDMALEPHVEYSFYNDFEVKDCYRYRDTVKFKNKSLGFVASPMYNRYALFGLERFCHYWNYGDNYRQYIVDGERKYTSGQNRVVSLASQVYSLRGGRVCRDTTIKDLHFQPDEINLTGDRRICDGDSALIRASTNGQVYWYNNYQDTMAIDSGLTYYTKPLQQNDTLYAQSINRQCSTQRKTFVVEALERPTVPIAGNDSVCQNAKANLSASTSTGIIRWYPDSTVLAVVHEGTVLETAPLNNDTFFFVKAFNDFCTHEGRVRVSAFVDSEFAPQAPDVMNDTTICLIDGAVDLDASSPYLMRWYDKPSGGSVLDTGKTIAFTPAERGKSYRYVEAYDGRCASSRLPIEVEVHHFGTVPTPHTMKFCEDEHLILNLTGVDSDLYWYESESSLTPVHTGNIMDLGTINKDTSFYLQPFEGICLDTARTRYIAFVVPFPRIDKYLIDTGFCDGSEPHIELDLNMGQVYWYTDTLEQAIDSGSTWVVGEQTQDFTGYYRMRFEHCVAPFESFTSRALLQPDANFDFQIYSWRKVDFLSRLTGQGTYMWDFMDNGDTAMGTDVSHRFTADGDYDVQLIVASDEGCSDTVIKTVTINTVGIGEHALSATVKMFPNPSNGLMNVHLSELPVNTLGTLSVYSSIGHLIREQNVLSSEMQIDLSDQPSGMYHLELQIEGETVHFPFFIK